MQLSDYQNRYTSIEMTREDGVLEVRMHTKGGPALWGTLLTSLHAELPEAFADIARDPENKVVILTGTGDTFIHSFDPDGFAPEPIGKFWDRIYREGTDLLKNLLAIPVPVIAAVNGPALVHAELAVLSDIVLAADHAEFADIAHTINGTVPGDGVHTVWPMLLGPNRGRYFLLTGERIPALEAKQLGICAEVLPADKLMDRAREHARTLAAHPLPLLRNTRAVLTRDLRKRMEAELEFGLGAEALASLAAMPG
ncbi:MAG TPA: enoyl-CoA hydratase/isomerase family protein [Verrucomicrobiae bacterium]|jgi:enoyl-CoA hydratase/carnithine racemase|nr:enoyl-CoA hydratase/isomerase family protein [Verrucomicrobiae bacterium]